MLDRQRGRLAAGLSLLGVAAAAWLLWSGAVRSGSLTRGFLGALPSMASWLGLGVGCALLALGVRRRVGDTAVCSRCGYAVVQASRLLPNCPECGRAWRWFGGTRRGTPLSRPFLARAGALLATLALFTALVRAVSPETWVRATPRGVLLAQLGRGPWYATREHWAELERRALKPDEERWLIDTLLERRVEEGRLDEKAHTWLWGRWFLGTMSRTQEDRYFGEVVALGLDAPTSVLAGEELPFSVLGVFRGDRFGLHGEEEVWIVRDYARLDPVSGGVDPAMLPPAPPPDPALGPVRFRFARPVDAAEFAEQTRVVEGLSRGPGSGSVLAPEKPGPARLTVVLHVFIARRGVMPDECEWIEGPALHVPVGTTRHLRVQLTKVVDVKPAPGPPASP